MRACIRPNCVIAFLLITLDTTTTISTTSSVAMGTAMPSSSALAIPIIIDTTFTAQSVYTTMLSSMVQFSMDSTSGNDIESKMIFM